MESFVRRNRHVLFIGVFILIIFLLYYARVSSDSHAGAPGGIYAHQETYLHYTATSAEYEFVLVSDMDKASKFSSGGKDQWRSELKYGTLRRDPRTGYYSMELTKETEISSKLNEAGRGMELSDACFFNGQLYTFDDRTGILYQLRGKDAVPVQIMMDGDGIKTKGFKGEWCTVKDDVMYIGGMGKEWVNQHGITENYDPQWIKSLNTNNQLQHIDWVYVYEMLREVTGTKYPGYLLHEAVAWHPVQRRWFFFPRRVSTEAYDADEDEYRGSNIAISLDENFSNAKIHTNMGKKIETRGFSSVKFVPFREDEFVLLKTSEVDGVHSWMTVINMEGKVLMEEVRLGSVKYEGIEFV